MPFALTSAPLPDRAVAGRHLAETTPTFPNGLSPSDAERSRIVDEMDLHGRIPDEHLQAVVRWITHYFNFPMGFINILGSTHEKIIVKAGMGDDPFPAFPRGGSICRYVVAGNHPMVIPDLSQSPLLPDNQAPHDMGIRAYVGVPLTDDGTVTLGTLCLTDTCPRTFSESQLELLMSIAQTAMRYLKGDSGAAPWMAHQQGHPWEEFHRLGVAVRNDLWVAQQPISLAVLPGASTRTVQDLGAVSAFFTLSESGDALVCYPLSDEAQAKTLAQDLIDASGWQAAAEIFDADMMETWPELCERALEGRV